jgi:putative ABC transport system permease protein
MKINPPQRSLQFLRWFCREDYLEEIEGDLMEVFVKQAEVSPRKAKWKFGWSVLRYFRPEFIKSLKNYQPNHQAMLQHNLLLTYRKFKRYKSSFLINLVGLSTGLACTFIIYLWVSDELSVDKFNKKDDRLFRAMEHRISATGIWTSSTTPGPLAEALAGDMPEVEYAITDSRPKSYSLSLNDKSITALGRFVGKDFFNMFSYELIAGTVNQILTDKNSVVISDVLALKLFNTTENIIGKAIDFQHESQLQISGIFKSIPSNASEQFDFVGSFEKFKEGQDWLLSWGNTGTQTLVLLKPGVNSEAFNTKIADYIKIKTNNEITHRTLFLKGYSENYLYGNYENGVLAGGRITYVKLFSIIAIFILLMYQLHEFVNSEGITKDKRSRYKKGNWSWS